jgi:uncharacterized protein YuzE
VERLLQDAATDHDSVEQSSLRSSGSAVKVVYDRQTDTLVITLRDQRIRESDEIRPSVIADFGYGGGIVRFEVLRASQVVEKTTEMQFAVAA